MSIAVDNGVEQKVILNPNLIYLLDWIATLDRPWVKTLCKLNKTIVNGKSIFLQI